MRTEAGMVRSVLSIGWTLARTRTGTTASSPLSTQISHGLSGQHRTQAHSLDIPRILTCRNGFWRTSRTYGIGLRIRSPAALANFVPLVVERKPVLVKCPLADRLNAVEPQVALVRRLEARRDVDRCWELRALRPIPGHFAVVLHEDDRAVIGAKRRPDVGRYRTLGTDQQPVRGCGAHQLTAQAIPLNLDARHLNDHSSSGAPVAHHDRRLQL